MNVINTEKNDNIYNKKNQRIIATVRLPFVAEMI